jgi:hypothetical protein
MRIPANEKLDEDLIVRNAIEELDQLRKENTEALSEAKALCLAIYNSHFKKSAPQFEMLDNTAGVISQIDNMTAGLSEENTSLFEENKRLKERVEKLKKVILNSRDICLMLDVPICPRAEAAEAKVKELETQLAGRTYCHSDEAVEEKLKRYEEVVSNVIANAVIGPDVETDGITDCYHVPFDDLDAVKELNSEE